MTDRPRRFPPLSIAEKGETLDDLISPIVSEEVEMSQVVLLDT